MKKINRLFFLFAISFECAFAYDVENGEELYNEASCYECHEASHYIHEDRLAKDLKQLNDRVNDCRYKTDAEWFDEDKDDVVHYLNTNYYKYEVK